MKITEGVEIDPREFRKHAGMSEAAKITPDQYERARPKVIKELEDAVKWIPKDVRVIKGQPKNPRRAFITAMNLGFWAAKICKALGDDATATKFKAAQESARQSAVQFPEE